MEKDENRDLFLMGFDEFCNKVELTDTFLDLLRKYRSFENNMKTVDRLKTMNEKKIFILLEFTQHRSTCNKIIEFLRQSGSDKNVLAALDLEKFNTSQGSLKYELVVRAKKVMEGSLYYDMIHKPRGKCIIINNHIKYIRNSVFLDLEAYGQLYYESIEFQRIFQDLGFEVELESNLNTKQIRNKLNSISKESRLAKSDALIVMILTHGQNESILGYDACVGNDENDSMPISEVINIFSDNNCSNLKDKPKIFFFNCCRIRNFLQSKNFHSVQTKLETNSDSVVYYSCAEKFPKLETLNEIHTQSDSFVCYSCAEGEESWNFSRNMSLFGIALSRSLKQYSCEESLTSILSRTSTLIDNLLDGYKNYESRPEIRGLFLRRQLFFNPGFP